MLAACLGLSGLATCLGASTVMLGSGVAAVAVCDMAVSLGPHNNAIDRIATAEGATNLDDNLMTCPSKIRDGHAVPTGARYHAFRIGSPKVAKISDDDSPSTWKQTSAVPSRFGRDAVDAARETGAFEWDLMAIGIARPAFLKNRSILSGGD